MIVAWIALISWPLLAMIFFASMSLPVALVMTIVGGYLFLPEQVSYNLPILPRMDKHSIPALSALLMATVVALKLPGSSLKGYIPRHPVVLGLLIVFLLSVVATWLTNSEPVIYQERWRPEIFLPGLRSWDLLSNGLLVVMALVPFLLGRKFLATAEAQKQGLVTFILLALAYTLLALIEIRLSPQLNSWIYGFFPHSFAQHIRGGGFRPLVFLNHGLWLAIFLCTALVAAAGMARFLTDKNQRFLFSLAMLWILFTLVLSKNLGALLIALIFLALLTLPQRFLHIGMLCMVGLVIFYPLLRATGLIPVDLIVGLAERISPERAQSLRFRLINEQALLNHALQKPLFGWGFSGRNLAVVTEEFGRRAVPDGRWTISMGQGGYVRFLSEFGLLAVGILGVLFRRRPVHFTSTVVAMLLTANLFDLLPNGTLTPLTWLWAGALAGRLERVREESRNKSEHHAEPAAAVRHDRPAYARDLGLQEVYRRHFNQTGSSR